MRILIMLAVLLLAAPAFPQTDYRDPAMTWWLPGPKQGFHSVRPPVCYHGHRLLRILELNGYRLGGRPFIAGNELYAVYSNGRGKAVYVKNRNYWSMTERIVRNCVVMTGHIDSIPTYSTPVIRIYPQD